MAGVPWFLIDDVIQLLVNNLSFLCKRKWNPPLFKGRNVKHVQENKKQCLS
jgi:hypothetical protein